MKRVSWIFRRFVWSPVRTLLEIPTGILFYGYVALSLGIGGAILASSDRSSSPFVQAGWLALEVVRYAALCLAIWLVASVYFTLFDREIFLSAWRETYRPWLSRAR
jgi:hypothetical protein